jgi:hypothetical protein
MWAEHLQIEMQDPHNMRTWWNFLHQERNVVDVSCVFVLHGRGMGIDSQLGYLRRRGFLRAKPHSVLLLFDRDIRVQERIEREERKKQRSREQSGYLPEKEAGARHEATTSALEVSTIFVRSLRRIKQPLRSKKSRQLSFEVHWFNDQYQHQLLLIFFHKRNTF